MEVERESDTCTMQGMPQNTKDNQKLEEGSLVEHQNTSCLIRFLDHRPGEDEETPFKPPSSWCFVQL